jgi:DNA-binding NtrC family response regulator
MRTNVLVADDDMSTNQLICDILDICIKGVRVERAMNPQSFWAKLPAPPDGRPWGLLFLSAEYIKEEPDGFMERLAEANPEATGKVVIVGAAADAESFGGLGENGESANAPFLAKPFSLDRFEELVKQIQNQNI